MLEWDGRVECRNAPTMLTVMLSLWNALHALSRSLVRYMYVGSAQLDQETSV